LIKGGICDAEIRSMHSLLTLYCPDGTLPAARPAACGAGVGGKLLKRLNGPKPSWSLAYQISDKDRGKTGVGAVWAQSALEPEKPFAVKEALHFRGAIDELQIFNTVLTEHQIGAYYNKLKKRD